MDVCRSRSLRIVLQEFIPGSGAAAYSAYVTRDGRIAGDYSSRRVVLYPPDIGVCCLEVAQRIPSVLEASRRLVRALGYNGAPVNIDFKFDPRDRVWKLHDLNARSWLQISLATLVGVPIFDLLLADYAGRPAPAAGPVRYGRSWLAVKEALLLARAYPGRGPRPRDFARMLSSRFALGLFDVADLGPFFADIAPLFLRRFARKVATSASKRA